MRTDFYFSTKNVTRCVELFDQSLIEYYSVNNKNTRNLGWRIFPQYFWKNFHFSYDWFGAYNKRLIVCLGIFDFYIDFPNQKKCF